MTLELHLNDCADTLRFCFPTLDALFGSACSHFISTVWLRPGSGDGCGSDFQIYDETSRYCDTCHDSA